MKEVPYITPGDMFINEYGSMIRLDVTSDSSFLLMLLSHGNGSMYIDDLRNSSAYNKNIELWWMTSGWVEQVKP